MMEGKLCLKEFKDRIIPEINTRILVKQILSVAQIHTVAAFNDTCKGWELPVFGGEDTEGSQKFRSLLEDVSKVKPTEVNDVAIGWIDKETKEPVNAISLFVEHALYASRMRDCHEAEARQGGTKEELMKQMLGAGTCKTFEEDEGEGGAVAIVLEQDFNQQWTEEVRT